MVLHFFIRCTLGFTLQIFTAHKMNNSAFKANVHLNIISLSSLFFPCQSIGKTLLPDYLDSCGSAFCKDANVDGFPFFVFSESTKGHLVDCFVERSRHLKKLLRTLPDSPKKSISQSVSLFLSVEMKQDRFMSCVVFGTFTFALKS